MGGKVESTSSTCSTCSTGLACVQFIDVMTWIVGVLLTSSRSMQVPTEKDCLDRWVHCSRRPKSSAKRHSVCKKDIRRVEMGQLELGNYP